MSLAGHVIEHPNREKAASKATRAAVVLLLVASAVVVAVVTVGGWAALEGAKPLQIAYIALYLLLAALIARWHRGLLPVAAAAATVLAIFAAVSGPLWLDRDKPGFTDPLLGASVLALLTFLLVPLQVLLAALAMRGFAQRWNVEVERPLGDPPARAPLPA